MNGTIVDSLHKAPPDALALIDDTDEVAYGDLLEQTGQVANLLVSQYGSGHFIVIRSSQSVRFVTTLLGIVRSGNTPIPVASDLPAHEVKYIREKSGAVTELEPLEPDDYVTRSSTDHVDPSRPAIVMFTSGTTGYPKGVIISHDNLMHSCRAISGYLDYHTYRSAAVVLPLHYSYALLSQVCCQLYVHGRVRLFRDTRNPIKISRIITQLNLETFCGVPSTYFALTEIHRLSRLSMPTIRVLCSAGAAMDRARLREVKEICPNALFFNNYGMTEAAPRIAYVREDDPRFQEATCGRPMEGVEVQVVDPETHEPLAEGQPGVLAVRGPNITAGYLNDPERTAEAFTSAGFLLSGDAAYLDGGYIFVDGRNDEIFNVAGEKVSPLEIERILNDAPGVEMSAVVGVPDVQRGNVPVAFLKVSRSVSRKCLIEQIKTQLLDIKIPQRFLEVHDFPTTSNGKLKRKDLSPDNSDYVIREIT